MKEYREVTITMSEDSWDKLRKLEDENRSLINQLDSCRERNVVIGIEPRAIFNYIKYSFPREIGCLVYDGPYGYNISIDKERVLNEIKKICPQDMISRNEYNLIIDKVGKLEYKISKLPKFIRWIFGIKY